MEHQSAVTYGNRFANGYLERDWTGVGISLKFDFIIIHESGHEWFGNAVSAADVSDMWIHEGWTHVPRGLYVEHVFGYDDALKYINGYKTKVAQPGADHHAARHPPHAAAGHVLQGRALPATRCASVVNDDARWWKLMRDTFQHFKYQNIMTEDIVRFFNERDWAGPDADLRSVPAARRRCRRSSCTFDETAGTVSYRWKADERGFAMPIGRHARAAGRPIQPTTEWQVMPTSLTSDAFDVRHRPLLHQRREVLDAAGHPAK